MTDSAAEPGSDDALLTGYLDGEITGAERAALEQRLLAEPALKVRLDQLGGGGRAFGTAFDALLAAAPQQRLSAMLADVIGGRAPRRRDGWRRFAAIAAAIVIFIAGAAAGALWPSFVTRAPASPGWRQVVAEYQSLTTAETLAAIPGAPETISAELSVVGQKLSLDLTADKLALPDLALKEAQLFQFGDKPLVQVAYLSPADGPIAFCIIASGTPDAGFDFEQREGYNIVYWTKAGRGYMLIGKAPQTELQAFADGLAARIS
jgi:anti-sigma factor RsiW